MMIDPAPVFLGEPSVCLDAKSSRLVFETAIVLRDGGRSVLMVAQHVCSGRAVSAYGTVVALGVVRLTGKASEPLDDPELGQSYLRASTVHHRRPLDTEHALT